MLNVQFGGSTEQSISLHKDGIYSFSVCLIGAMSRYYASFIEAIKKMCARGIGTPMVSLNLIDVSETHPFHASRLLWFNGTETINELKLPIRFDDFVQQPALKNKIRIQLITPLNLVQSREKKNKGKEKKGRVRQGKQRKGEKQKRRTKSKRRKKYERKTRRIKTS